MGASAHLSDSALAVEPGKIGSVTMEIYNDGSVVDRFTFEALGAAAPWTTFTPDTLSLFPGATGSVTVSFSPPRSSTTMAGATPAGVRVASDEDPGGSIVEELTILVGAFSDVSAELIPRVQSGRMLGRVRLAIDNRSNCDYQASLSGSDPKGTLAFSFRPATFSVPSGNAIFVKTTVRPRTRFWRGPARTHPFRVVLRDEEQHGPEARGRHASNVGTAVQANIATPADAGSLVTARPPTSSPHKEEIVAEGSLLQEAMVPRWVLPSLIILALLVLLWFFLFKPTIHNDATDAAQQQLAPLNAMIADAQRTATAANQTATAAANKVGAPVSSATPTTLPAGGPLTTPTGARLSLNLAPNASGSQNLPGIPAGKSFDMTDVVFENARGDTGTVSIAQGGTVVLQESLANFRSLDYHFVSPIAFPPGAAVTFQATCSNPPGQNCTPAAYIGGFIGS
jgi:hypothetical protein